MKWIGRFQLFLFDFDGLLVNTEHLHYQAYRNMLARRGFELSWSFADFCNQAHLNDTALREGIYREFPGLDPDWNALYAEKKEAYQALILSGKVELMEGVKELLEELARLNVRRAVVTNSTYEQTRLIRSQQPVLQSIPHWITREDYEKPKPDPEGYLRAIAMYGKPGDRIIGFEDTLRGLAALRGTPAFSVLVCPPHYPLAKGSVDPDVLYVESFANLAAALS